MRVELDGLEIELERSDDVITVNVRCLRDGRTRTLAVHYFNADEDFGRVRISDTELRGAGLAADA